MALPDYAETFRGLPACPCQVEWIPALEAELRRQDIGFQGTLSIAQMIGLFEASGNTHGDPNGKGLRKGGGATDFWLTGSLADRAVRVMRDMGADATWRRPKNWDGDGGSEHIHSVQRGCPHATENALGQIWAVDLNGDGLVGDAHDPGPRPLSGRTWREGIKWAREQGDDMPPYSEWKQADKDDLAADVQAAVAAELDKTAETTKGKRSLRQQVKETFQK